MESTVLKESEEVYHSKIYDKIFSIFNYSDFSEKSIENIVNLEFERLHPKILGFKNREIDFNEFDRSEQQILNYLDLKNYTENHLRELILSDIGSNLFEKYPENLIFLNFNYTNSTHKYWNEFQSFTNPFEKVNLHHIQIHGSLNKSENNPIIFGYGDEVDVNYQEIENLNDNRYLENVKSIKYLETDNYKKLLSFIYSGNYQVFIMGHSCGNSDRTLLNTIFEHDNCCSIKVFYHKRADRTDNYTDIIQNISRNFTDKKKMRDVVVNKQFCKPLL